MPGLVTETVEVVPSTIPVKTLEPADDVAITKTAQKILDIIYQYRLHKSIDAHDKWQEGTPKFLAVISRFIKNNQVLRMAIPAFPFKSANKIVKVLGTLPDKAEETALSYLNRMCDLINEVYSPGAKLLIISDGLVYNGKVSQL